MLSREKTVSSGDVPVQARWLLADRVSRALSGYGLADAGDAGERVVRLAMPVAPVDPFCWLREQRLFPKSYWSGRGGTSGVAAAGVADLQQGGASEGPGALRKRLAPLLASDDSGARYYGGLRFDPSRQTDEEWAAFGGFRFVLPRFELHTREDGATLVCNLVLPRDAGRSAEILEQVENLAFPRDDSDTDLPVPVSRSDSPDKQGWIENVGWALAAFSEGGPGKMVLARRAEFGFVEGVDPLLLAERLEGATPGCFHFYVEPEEGVAFLGASPERLFRREGRCVESEAVAGTRPRGGSSADDAGLRDELLRSEKDRSEHDYVRVGIRESLAPLCDELEVEEGVSEMKGASRRHLVSKVRGTLREGVTDAEVLGALHPTPAVGGHPRGEALAGIRSLEAFDRGWYAGPVGWVGKDAAEFAVGIRSALVRRREVALFSGAGIVAGSVPDEEWAEIEQKIGDFLEVLGIGPGHAAR